MPINLNLVLQAIKFIWSEICTNLIQTFLIKQKNFYIKAAKILTSILDFNSLINGCLVFISKVFFWLE